VEAGLGWKMLGALIQPKLVTKSDFGVLQVIAEYVALDEFGENEGRHGGKGEEETA
jgi:hypothetical protein